jgi:hypothetical protein
MPATGTITYTTDPLSAQSNADEDAFWPKTWTMAVTPNLLKGGENIIAVEVHQISSSTSDISFNLDLIGTSAQTASWQTATIGGASHLLWTGPWVLQKSDTLTNWVERPDIRSPWRIETDATRGFFKLQQ